MRRSSNASSASPWNDATSLNNLLSLPHPPRGEAASKLKLDHPRFTSLTATVFLDGRSVLVTRSEGSLIEGVGDLVPCQGVPEDGADQLIVGVPGGSCGLGEAGVGVRIRDQPG